MAKSGFGNAARKGRRETASKQEAVKKREAEEKSVVSARVPADLAEDVRRICHGRSYDGHKESISSVITDALAAYRKKHREYLGK